jgi:hypothetical protein
MNGRTASLDHLLALGVALVLMEFMPVAGLKYE